MGQTEVANPEKLTPVLAVASLVQMLSPDCFYPLQKCTCVGGRVHLQLTDTGGWEGHLALWATVSSPFFLMA